MVVIKWLDLGDGLTPTDLRWKANVAYRRIDQPVFLGDIGDVCTRFESQAGISQASLSELNASYISSQIFRKLLDPWTVDTWILQGGRRMPFLKYISRLVDTSIKRAIDLWCNTLSYFMLFVIAYNFVVMVIYHAIPLVRILLRERRKCHRQEGGT